MAKTSAVGQLLPFIRHFISLESRLRQWGGFMTAKTSVVGQSSPLIRHHSLESRPQQYDSSMMAKTS